MKKKLLIIFMLIGIIALNIIVAQVTNSIAKQQLENKGRIEVVGDLFVMQYAENDGAFLSFGSGLSEPFKSILLMIGPALILIVMTGMIFMDKDVRLLNGLIKNIDFSLPERITMACIIGGGFSNIGERIINGHVIDFLNFGIPGIDLLRTGILNFADLSIFFGAAVLIIMLFRKDHQLKKMKQQQEASTANEEKK